MAAKKTTTKKTDGKTQPQVERASSKSATDKKAAEKKATKKARAKKADGKMSCIDAAAKVLSESKQPMTTGQMIEAMAAKGYWTSPGGQTPAATLYSALLRQIQTKGKECPFVKTERGKFALKAAK